MGKNQQNNSWIHAALMALETLHRDEYWPSIRDQSALLVNPQTTANTVFIGKTAKYICPDENISAFSYNDNNNFMKLADTKH